jgi:hypothetical protein
MKQQQQGSPSIVVEFADGQTFKLTVYSATGEPDVCRGLALAGHAYRSRMGHTPEVEFRFHFERNGELLELSAADMAKAKEYGLRPISQH